MYFTELHLTNFGQFDGEHIIDLRPDAMESGISSRPIILFGGKNGTGKTTLLEAVKLCLYGTSSLGAAVRRPDYEAYLAQRIYRQPGAPLHHTFAEVGVSFVHSAYESTYNYKISRVWHRKPRGVEESLTVWRDGKPLEEHEYVWWDGFLRDLLPPGLADLFFFDGEKIQGLADDPDYTALRQAVRSLLGLDLVDQLRADLNIFAARQRRKGQTSLDEELQSLERELVNTNEAFDAEYSLLVSINSTLVHKRGKVEDEERRLASEGGTTATRRSELQQRAETLRDEIARCERDITELANNLLPFAIIPVQCIDLSKSLTATAEQHNLAMAHQAASTLTRDLLDALTSDQHWLEGTSVTATERDLIMSRLADTVNTVSAKILPVGPDPETPPLHDLSSSSRLEISNWIQQATTDVPRRVAEVAHALEERSTELAQIETRLLNIPADEAIQPILQRLASLNQDIGRLEAQKLAQDSVVQDLRNKRAELERRQQDVYARMMRGDDPGLRLQLASRVQGTLVKYEDALRRTKLRDLEQKVVECFSRIAQKGNLVRRVTIDPDTFETTLFNNNDDVLPKEQLSAGEKQIYAIALLWALRLVSGRSLPVIIDTPLGRLDKGHRRSLVQGYFPQASHQVILLSTDTELDEDLYTRLTPAISHEYHLVYQPHKAASRVAEGYFWQPATIGDEEVSA